MHTVDKTEFFFEIFITRGKNYSSFWLRNKNPDDPPQGSVVRLLARGSAAYRKGLKVLIPPLF